MLLILNIIFSWVRRKESNGCNKVDNEHKRFEFKVCKIAARENASPKLSVL